MTIPFIRNGLISLAAVAIVMYCSACSSSSGLTTSKSDSTNHASVVKATNFKFSLYISGSGGPTKTEDTWTMDTTGYMSVKTASMTSPGHWNNVMGLAQLEPADFDSLRSIVWNGKLWKINQADISQQCPGEEIFHLMIVPLDSAGHATLQFQSCAQDYNLLLGSTRREFKHLMTWFEKMRVKYRPAEPK